MTWIPDFHQGAIVIAGLNIRAIGWLDPPHEFPVGAVPAGVVDALRAYRAQADVVEEQLGFPSVMGFHQCGFCPPQSVPADGRVGLRNLGVPFGNLLFVCPELVSHYVDTHHYRPPDPFIEAILAAPPPASPSYAAQVRPILARLARYEMLSYAAERASSAAWIAKAMCPTCGAWSYEYGEGMRAKCRCGQPLVSRSANPDPVAPTPRRWVVVMGVAGSGKSTVAAALAERLAAHYLDADDLHPPGNIAKMRRGEPLDDADRQPWLAELHDLLAAYAGQGRSLVIACSALREAYRRQLRGDLAGVEVVHLRAPREVLAARLAARPSHFFPTALLDSQLAALEEPTDALVVDATLPVERIVALAAAARD